MRRRIENARSRYVSLVERIEEACCTFAEFICAYYPNIRRDVLGKVDGYVRHAMSSVNEMNLELLIRECRALYNKANKLTCSKLPLPRELLLRDFANAGRKFKGILGNKKSTQ